MEAKNSLQKIPHSWAVDEWPSNVYSGRASKARYTLRSHRSELVAAGALVRVGRDLVVMGGAYASWLAQKANRVDGFSIAANRERIEPQAA
jgi:hypothetical protein